MKHYLYDVENINYKDLLRFVQGTKFLLNTIVKELNFSILLESSSQTHNENNFCLGCSIMYLLKNSQLNIHTNAINNTAHLDLFIIGNEEINEHIITQNLVHFFGVTCQNIKLTIINRSS